MISASGQGTTHTKKGGGEPYSLWPSSILSHLSPTNEAMPKRHVLYPARRVVVRGGSFRREREFKSTFPSVNLLPCYWFPRICTSYFIRPKERKGAGKLWKRRISYGTLHHLQQPTLPPFLFLLFFPFSPPPMGGITRFGGWPAAQ